ncbi:MULTISPECIES: PhzF family phenazine biosynthesis protein [unclassified Sphingopyxis]|uniref:PhzF family phenazine biosynthesis protein n=1 Tax=unclassified Sphingopyxis TaxID=2614943 RepID=UPI002855A854|nr:MULTISPECIES: PhzF family phenazine biosynthesis protein [unclassified Sphingopyxis]MDR6834599.1 PhzF family phenazine biosynthesis protein [Sphingopyxis sp. BE122]MDR7226869.1 PhzF family phenazine biosynthesis protein [Sphingopyxis sp. BE259]
MSAARRLPMSQVDAFADRAFTGNPAAVMPLEEWLGDGVLQAIAAENNLAETAFLVPDESGEADYELRWFTPTVEVALCGHATLASGHVLLSAAPWRQDMRFRTRKAGILHVARVLGDDGEDAGYRMTLPAYAPAPKAMPDIVRALGGDAVETQWHPGGYAVIAYADTASVRALEPDFRALRDGGDVLYIATAPGDGDRSGADVVSRCFAPGAGIDEDPVTGSAHSVLTPYWAARLGRGSFAAYQASKRGGHVGCRLDGDMVELTGRCVTTLVGDFLL